MLNVIDRGQYSIQSADYIAPTKNPQNGRQSEDWHTIYRPNQPKV